MERTDMLELMSALKLYGMRAAYDEVMTTGIKRRHEPPRIVGDLLTTGYQAFDACFRRRVYRATAWGLSAGALPGWCDLHPSAYGHAAGQVVRARAITAMVLRSRLQNPVEGRLRRAPDALEAARPDYLANPCLAGLRRARHRPPATARSARRPSSNPRN
jgi:hypothetical protein